MTISRSARLASLVFLAAAGCQDPTPPRPPPPVAPVVLPAVVEPPKPGAMEARVMQVVGRAEKKSVGAWKPLQAGDKLRADDAVRTAGKSSVDLEIGEGSRLTLSDSSEVQVAELTTAVHRLRVTQGRVAVDYAADGVRSLRIESEDGRSVAQTSGAKFSVVSVGASFAVATETGGVNLNASGASVMIGPGQQSLTLGAEVPAAPQAIPAAILLKLAAAAARTDQGLCTTIEGQVAAGSEVFVEGTRAEVSREGRFRVAVPRAPGKLRAALLIRDTAGRSREETLPCAAAPKGGIDGLKIQWKD